MTTSTVGMIAAMKLMIGVTSMNLAISVLTTAASTNTSWNSVTTQTPCMQMGTTIAQTGSTKLYIPVIQAPVALILINTLIVEQIHATTSTVGACSIVTVTSANGTTVLMSSTLSTVTNGFI